MFSLKTRKYNYHTVTHTKTNLYCEDRHDRKIYFFFFACFFSKLRRYHILKVANATAEIWNTISWKIRIFSLALHMYTKHVTGDSEIWRKCVMWRKISCWIIKWRANHWIVCRLLWFNWYHDLILSEILPI